MYCNKKGLVENQVSWILFVWSIPVDQGSMKCEAGEPQKVLLLWIDELVSGEYFSAICFGFFRVLWNERTIQKWFIAPNPIHIWDILILYSETTKNKKTLLNEQTNSICIWVRELVPTSPPYSIQFQSHKIAAIYCSFDLLFRRTFLYITDIYLYDWRYSSVRTV